MMRQQTAIVLALLVAAMSVVGAASYTQATVDRDANINVQADNSALVGLEVGNGISSSDNSVKMENGNLVLNLDDGGTGVNGNATFHYGAKTARDRTNSAFNITNNDDAASTFALSYSETSSMAETDSNVKFDVYTYDGTTFTSAGTVTEEGGTVSSTLSTGEKLYVFVTIDTDTGDLDASDDLSGTFTVEATQ